MQIKTIDDFLEKKAKHDTAELCIRSYTLNGLLEETKKHGATDLHICVGSAPLMRVNSRLVKIPETRVLSVDDVKIIVLDCLDQAKKDTLERDKVVDFSYSKSGLGRFRCNIYKQRGTYAMAVRMLPLDIPGFSTLGLPDTILQFTKKSRGLVLLTGATGCGKSTTLASLIDIINKEYSYHILTIEDPVEYLHSHDKSLVTQREIGEDATSFSSALRSALREDPDVIMVGEMRDKETMAIALSAAETGHLVFSTLHTIGAVKTIDRILDSFPSDHQNQIRSQLATVLEGIVSQQLLPKKSGDGLVPACEVMVSTPAVRNLIREEKHYQINNIIQTGKDQGMCSLERNLADLTKKDIIEEETAKIKAQNIRLFEQYLNLAKR
ncbi:MAG: type IV pilus twitching motility protein PilT [Eubacteriales bacterium]|nr:type IV pilus twitching motility protein PilT [Eubacteriales bacterium]